MRFVSDARVACVNDGLRRPFVGVSPPHARAEVCRIRVIFFAQRSWLSTIASLRLRRTMTSRAHVRVFSCALSRGR